MNQLQDMLTEQARSVAGGTSTDTDRVTAVRRRITVVRRRRAAGAVAAVVLALVGATGVIHLKDPSPAMPTSGARTPSTLVGRSVPKTIEIGGAVYRYSSGITNADGRLEFELPARTQDLYVRVATGGDSGTVTTRIGGADADPVMLRAGDFGYAQHVGSGDALTFLAKSSSGPVAAAVYAFERPPAGYTVGGLTYPDLIGGARLLGASIGSRGDSSTTLRVKTQTRTLQLDPVCVGVPESARIKISFTNEPGYLMLGGCAARSSWNAVDGSNSRIRVAAPDGHVDFTVRLVDRHDKALAVPADGRVGLGVYVPPSPDRKADFDTVIGFDGHTWRLATTKVIAMGDMSTVVDGTTPHVLAAGDLETSKSTERLIIDGKLASTFTGGRTTSLIATGKAMTRVGMRGGDSGQMANLGIYDLVE